MVSVSVFVTQRFGVLQAAKLENMNRGGRNNQKGGSYENFFAVSKICELAADDALNADQCFLVAQEEGFVDDFVLRLDQCNTKRNYQLRNSQGASAQWTDELKLRFEMQQQIDNEHHQYMQASQHLVVPCLQLAKQNQQQMAEHMRDYAIAEFFPGYSNSVELLTNHQALRQNLVKLTTSERLDDLDFGFKLLLGIWQASAEKRSIAQILAQAECDGLPNVFAVEIVDQLPDWLNVLLAEGTFSSMAVHIKSGRVIVDMNGFKVSIAITLLNQVDSSHAQTIDTPFTLIQFMLNLAKSELEPRSGDDE